MWVFNNSTYQEARTYKEYSKWHKYKVVSKNWSTVDSWGHVTPYIQRNVPCFTLKQTLSNVQGGSNMTGTNCDLFTHNQSRSYLNHLVHTQHTLTDENGHVAKKFHKKTTLHLELTNITRHALSISAIFSHRLSYKNKRYKSLTLSAPRGIHNKKSSLPHNAHDLSVRPSTSQMSCLSP
jgi:hypothetical protein